MCKFLLADPQLKHRPPLKTLTTGWVKKKVTFNRLKNKNKTKTDYCLVSPEVWTFFPMWDQISQLIYSDYMESPSLHYHTLNIIIANRKGKFTV